RRFAVRGPHGEGARDDTEALGEVLQRRFKNYRASRESPVASGEIDAEGNPASASAIDPETGRPARFAYPPNLVVVDGGEPQVAAAQQAMDAQGVEDVALIGLAKRLEEVWLPGETFPLVLPRTSP